MLIQHYQLRDDQRSPGEQLRALHAHHGHLHPPGQDVFAQTIERFNRLRAKFVKDFPRLHTAIAMGMRSAPGGDPFPAPAVALLPKLGVVIIRVALQGACFPRSCCSNKGATALSPRVAPVSSAATGLQRLPTVTAQCRFQPYPQPCQPDWLQPAAGSIDEGGITPCSRWGVCHTPAPVARAPYG